METINTDVLIVGSGAAGIRAAFSAYSEGVEVLMISKRPVTESGSTFASLTGGWGIQALVGDERTEENLGEFYDDIVNAGLGMCDSKLAQILVEESGECFEELVSYGIRFRKGDAGNYLRVKGCFSDNKRAFFTESMQNIKQSFLSTLGGFDIKRATGTIFDLVVHDNSCFGAVAFLDHCGIVKINAKSTILACGGGSALFKDHFVSEYESGDGYALASRSGAELSNMEFCQFMLGIKGEGWKRFLPLDRLSNPGLLKTTNGNDLLTSYIKDNKERLHAVAERNRHFPFSCRDTSYLIDSAIAEVNDKSEVVIWDDTEDGKCCVLHFAHAFNGGVKIDAKAQSTVKGLFAAGEVASGPHGADRIGGCMMIATQVFGKRAGTYAAKRAKEIYKLKLPDFEDAEIVDLPGFCSDNNVSNTESSKIVKEIKHLLTKYCMIRRCHDGLVKCIMKLNSCKEQLEVLKKGSMVSSSDYFTTRNRIIAALVVAESADKRCSSLGSHFRIDCN